MSEPAYVKLNGKNIMLASDLLKLTHRLEQLEQDLATARAWIAEQKCENPIAMFFEEIVVGYEDCGSCMSCVERKRKADRNLQSEMACRKNALESVKEKISGIKWESIYQGKFVDDEESKDGND